MKDPIAALIACAALLACQSSSATSAGDASPFDSAAIVADLPVSLPPYEQVHANWKQRLDQQYVYVERRGSYARVGDALEEVWHAMGAQGIEACGPPFALYYDDPGKVAVEELRLRACFPVDDTGRVASPLASDVLESTTVVYAFVGGPYPDLPRAYPGLYTFLDQLGWVEAGPIREVYLVNPALVADPASLLAEIQIPATSAR